MRLNLNKAGLSGDGPLTGLPGLIRATVSQLPSRPVPTSESSAASAEPYPYMERSWSG